MKHRSKSIKRKGAQCYYANMIPAFTTEKRKKLYYSHPKNGFTYVNWEIEEELWKFQKDIEAKFAASQVNKDFKYPKVQTTEDKRESSLKHELLSAPNNPNKMPIKR